MENFFSIAKKNLIVSIDPETNLRQDAKNSNRARWLPERIYAIARSARNYVRIARDHSRGKFPLRSGDLEQKFFPHLSSSRNKFITFTWPHTSHLLEPSISEWFISRRESYGCKARVYRLYFRSNFQG